MHARAIMRARSSDRPPPLFLRSEVAPAVEEAADALPGAVVRRAHAEEILVERRGDLALARGLRLEGGERLEADAVVAAVGPAALLALVPEALRAHERYFDGIARLAPSPSVVARLDLDRPLAVAAPAALVGSRFHFLRAGRGGEGPHARPPGDPARTEGGSKEAARFPVWLHAVAARDLVQRSDGEVLELALAETRRLVPGAAAAVLLGGEATRDLAASIECRPDGERDRPRPRTPVEGLFLAASWVRTGLAATVESACRAAEEAVALVREFEPPPPPPLPAGFVPSSRLVRRGPNA
jgi:hypothetical protein